METLFSILQWALPGGGLGVAIGWLLSKNIRKTREAKEIHDTYKTMYRDVQSTLLDLQAQNDELVKTMARFKRAVYRASVCRYWPQCPVRNELRQQKNGTSGGGFDGANLRQPRRCLKAARGGHKFGPLCMAIRSISQPFATVCCGRWKYTKGAPSGRKKRIRSCALA